MMLQTYQYDGQTIDTLDLKVLLVTQGLSIPVDRVVERFGETHRVRPIVSRGARTLSADVEAILLPECFKLPDGTIIEMLNRAASPFSMEVPDTGNPFISYGGKPLAEIEFFPRTGLFEQTTSAGVPFPKIGQLHGADTMWLTYYPECAYAAAGKPCLFCYRGTDGQAAVNSGKLQWHDPTPRDIAEVVEFAFMQEKFAWDIGITGGSRIRPDGECAHVAEILREVDRAVDLENIPGEISVYMTAPRDPASVDQVFEAGADRVSHDMEVWDPELFEKICPGKAQFVGRDNWLKSLEYIREKHGHENACSIFVVGLEPLESLFEGLEYLCSRGIVPLLDVWQVGDRPILGKTEAPGLDYYRAVRRKVAQLYDTYNCEPPGRAGFSRCLCRDTWNHRAEIMAG